MHFAVVVLGDFGRSPRMQFHCASLQELDWVKSVSVIGTAGTPCIDILCNNPKVRLDLLPSYENAVLGRQNGILLAAVKVARQSLSLFYRLLCLDNVDCVLVQNVPCIPTFAVLLLFKALSGTNVVIDWHNLSFSIMQLSLHKDHWLVKAARMYEHFLGRALGDAHITVTKALKDWLVSEFGFNESFMTIQYDKASKSFRPRSLEEKHAFFERLNELGVTMKTENQFTLYSRDSHTVEFCPNRPLLLVSSTSWTADEDFGILLDALIAINYGLMAKKRKLFCIITGKGPQRAMYEQKIHELNLQAVQVFTMWLSDSDYRTILGCADLGVCLHCSSSNLDLPMKIVDMFGSGLPVCAMEYSCIGELVRHGKNGLLFKTSRQLAGQLHQLLLEPGCEDFSNTLRRGANEFAEMRWEDHWADKTAPLLAQMKGNSRNTPLRTFLQATVAFFFVFLVLRFFF